MKGAVIGRDCNIGDHAFIETGARIGDRVTLKNQAMVWDGVEIGDDVFVGPGVSFTNDVFPRSRRLPLHQVAADTEPRPDGSCRPASENGASLGARCVILPGAHIGAYAMVAAGAVVTRGCPGTCAGGGRAGEAGRLGLPSAAQDWSRSPQGFGVVHNAGRHSTSMGPRGVQVS